MAGIELDQEKIEGAVIEQAVAEIVATFFGGDHEWDLQERIRRILETKTIEHCDAVVKPVIEDGIKAFTFNATNRFGEGGEKPTTLTEYIVGLADSYLNTHVDYQGKEISKDAYGWKDKQSRLTYMIQEHLQYSIATAMKNAVSQVIKNIAPALAETCKAQIKSVTDDILRT